MHVDLQHLWCTVDHTYVCSVLQDPLFLQSYCRSADALLVAFSLTDQSSLNTAHDILQLACSNGRRPPAVLVGTKSDLQAERQVSFEKGLAVAKDLGCGYSETSAATHVNVTQAFHLAVKLSVYSSSSSVSDLCGGCAANLESKLQQSAKKGVREVLRKWSSLSRKKKLSSLLPQTDVSVIFSSA